MVQATVFLLLLTLAIVQCKCMQWYLIWCIRAVFQLFAHIHIRWKDMKNSFRLDKNTHLSVIPTLVNWKEKAKRLEGDQLCKPELLEMFLEQE